MTEHPPGNDADVLREVLFRMAEDVTRIKRVCMQAHPPKMGSPTKDWPAGTETRHSDGAVCVLLNDGDYALVPPGHVIPPGSTADVP